MRKLTLSDWASIAEVAGAIAVVLSLLYVGVQVKANTDEIRAANRQAFVNRSLLATGNIATSTELATAFAKIAVGAPLTPTETIQYQYFVRGLLYDIQESFLVHREGRLDDDYWETRAAIVLAYMAQPAAHEVYLRDKSLGVLDGDYVNWLDQVIADRYGN
jgi:hypothetical protein